MASQPQAINAASDGAPGTEAQQAGEASGQVSMRDLLTARWHTDDFTASRMEMLKTRLGIVQLLFAFGLVAWSPVDFVLLETGLAKQILVARVATGIVLLCLWMLNRGLPETRAKDTVLAATLTAIAAFHAASVVMLGHTEYGTLLGGYAALPFVLIALLALFPVGLIEGAGLIGVILLFTIGLGLYRDSLFAMATVNQLWMLSLVGVIVLWAEAGQLSMMLRLHRQLARDPLTGLTNRRVIERQLEREIRHASTRDDLAVLALQVDHFEELKRRYGLETGEAVLRDAAECLRSHFGATELLSRYGGEVFVVALPGTSVIEGAAQGERTRWSIDRMAFNGVEGERISTTASVAVTQASAGDSVSAVIARVYEGLDQAAKTGGDRVARC